MEYRILKWLILVICLHCVCCEIAFLPLPAAAVKLALYKYQWGAAESGCCRRSKPLIRYHYTSDNYGAPPQTPFTILPYDSCLGTRWKKTAAKRNRKLHAIPLLFFTCPTLTLYHASTIVDSGKNVKKYQLASSHTAATPAKHWKAIDYEVFRKNLCKRLFSPLRAKRLYMLLTGLQEQQSALLKRINGIRVKKKGLTQLIQHLLNHSTPADNRSLQELKETAEKANIELHVAKRKFEDADKALKSLLLTLPNTLDERVPYGNSSLQNHVVLEWESCNFKRKVGRNYLWHDEIATQDGCWHPKEAARMSGFKFSVYSGWISRLERSLSQFFMDTLIRRYNYTEISVPLIVSESSLVGTGQLPKFSDDLYHLSHQHTFNGETGYLIPTAEVPLINLFRDTVVEESKLPINLLSCTPCFRAESGTYGLDSRGLFRQHLFNKVELVKLCKPCDSFKEHELLIAQAETLLQLLELPYRRILLCSKETGFSSSMSYDLEVWMPGQQRYREISTCSNCIDFQARRLNIRWKAQASDGSGRVKVSKKKPLFCHTLNGSALAVGRALMAVLENYQYTALDGSIKVAIPSVLKPYMLR